MVYMKDIWGLGVSKNKKHDQSHTNSTYFLFNRPCLSAWTGPTPEICGTTRMHSGSKVRTMEKNSKSRKVKKSKSRKVQKVEKWQQKSKSPKSRKVAAKLEKSKSPKSRKVAAKVEKSEKSKSGSKIRKVEKSKNHKSSNSRALAQKSKFVLWNVLDLWYPLIPLWISIVKVCGPYCSKNDVLFWNAWHITTKWDLDYYKNGIHAPKK